MWFKRMICCHTETPFNAGGWSTKEMKKGKKGDMGENHHRNELGEVKISPPHK
jgi:hypothetical protein